MLQYLFCPCAFGGEEDPKQNLVQRFGTLSPSSLPSASGDQLLVFDDTLQPRKFPRQHVFPASAP
jgi:hypothetical protein